MHDIDDMVNVDTAIACARRRFYHDNELYTWHVIMSFTLFQTCMHMMMHKYFNMHACAVYRIYVRMHVCILGIIIIIHAYMHMYDREYARSL
jgi:hypothetical protein